LEAKIIDHQIESYWQHGIEVRPGDTVFDIGANIGLFSIKALQQHDTVRVFAFEPSPPVFAVLEKNQQLFGPERFHVFPMAISDRDGSSDFIYYPHSTVLSTLNPDIFENSGLLEDSFQRAIENPPAHLRWMRCLRWLPKRALTLYAHYLLSGKEVVRCELRTISSLLKQLSLPRIDLLKVDCEGEELKVLKGIDPEDWQKIEKLVVEIHDIEDRVKTIADMLRERGFSKVTVDTEKEFENLPVYSLYALR
jgi:FkbM family methyltransferase